MATKTSETPGAGAGGADASKGAGGAGGAQGGPTSSGAGGGASGGGGQAGAGGGSPAPTTIPLDLLPEEMRGRPQAELKILLANLPKAIRRANQEKEKLQNELNELKSRPAAPAEPAKPEKPLNERILEDPEAVIEEVLVKRFGERYSKLEGTVGKTVYSNVSSRFDDFGEYEDTIKGILDEQKLDYSEENILGAYTLAVGMRTIEDRRKSGQAAENSEIPKGDGGTTEQEPETSSLEEEVRQAFGYDKKTWVEYRDNDFEIEVPTGDEE